MNWEGCCGSPWRICTRLGVALMVATCAGMDGQGEMTVTHVEAGVYSSLRERAYLVFDGAEDFALWYRELHAHRMPAPPVPRIDFREHLAVAVSMGHRPSGGYGIRFSGVTWDDDTINLTVVERQPAPGTAQIAVVTSPYAIAAVARGELAEVVFVGAEGQVLALRQIVPPSRE